MREFIVRWTASGYCVDFYYMIISETLDKAKTLWNAYANNNSNIQYSWNKAVNAVKNHYGGYIVWKDNGETDKAEGCYEMETISTYEGSDHLRD